VLRELAALDEAPVPARPVLIGEVEGHPCAALSLRTGQLVADPFRPARFVGGLLRVRAEQIAVAGRSGRLASIKVAAHRARASQAAAEAASRASAQLAP
jgi:hypothetical protein